MTVLRFIFSSVQFFAWCRVRSCTDVAKGNKPFCAAGLLPCTSSSFMTPSASQPRSAEGGRVGGRERKRGEKSGWGGIRSRLEKGAICGSAAAGIISLFPPSICLPGSDLHQLNCWNRSSKTVRTYSQAREKLFPYPGEITRIVPLQNATHAPVVETGLLEWYFSNAHE